MILIVDDDNNITRSLRKALVRRGFDVMVAANGLEAYGLIRAHDCSCMLLDVNMPKISGVELLLLMQADGIEVPTIVMAGFSDFEEEEMARFGNVVKLFNKPFDLGEMVDAVGKYAA